MKGAAPAPRPYCEYPRGRGYGLTIPLRPARRMSAAEHERRVRAYARWIAQPEQTGLFKRVRRELRGKYLVCHCGLFGCHAEILAVIANTCIACETILDAVA